MQAKDATTLTRQIYFAVQVMLMDPAASTSATALASSLIQTALGAYRSPDLVAGLRGVAQSLARQRNFEAMKALRGLLLMKTRSSSSTAQPRAPLDKESP
jgi:flagellar protein FlbT